MTGKRPDTVGAEALDVHVVVSWSGDYEQAFLEEGSAGDAEGATDVYEADVPAELWAAYTVAYRAWRSAHRRILECIGFDEERGRMARPCPAWEGDLHPGRTSWSVALAGDDDPDHWPLGEAQLAWKPTERDAASFVESLPEEFYVLPPHGGPITRAARQRLRIRSAGMGPWASACHRCGWERNEHAAGAEDRP